MNETNILAGVEVINLDKDFADMYVAQIALQQRLDQIPMDTTNYKHAASKCIYWTHCVNAEVEELLEWLLEHSSVHWIKEMQMEAIDIVHFVFNLGIELGYTSEYIVDVEDNYEHQDWLIETQRVHAATLILNKSTIKLINLLPWKSWKNYKELPDLVKIHETYAEVLRATLMLCNACNLTRQDIINMYFAKNKVNHGRQDNDY